MKALRRHFFQIYILPPNGDIPRYNNIFNLRPQPGHTLMLDLDLISHLCYVFVDLGNPRSVRHRAHVLLRLCGQSSLAIHAPLRCYVVTVLDGVELGMPVPFVVSLLNRIFRKGSCRDGFGCSLRRTPERHPIIFLGWAHNHLYRALGLMLSVVDEKFLSLEKHWFVDYIYILGRYCARPRIRVFSTIAGIIHRSYVI